MPSLTIRDIPNEVMDKIKILSKKERRSINSEILMIIENGLMSHNDQNTSSSSHVISKETQLSIWENISGKWEDDRKTEDIINNIYESRSKGRDVEL